MRKDTLILKPVEPLFHCTTILSIYLQKSFQIKKQSQKDCLKLRNNLEDKLSQS